MKAENENTKSVSFYYYDRTGEIPKNTRAYYVVTESFRIPTEDGSMSLFSRDLVFDKGRLLEKRSDALDYCAHRMYEIEQRNLGEEPSHEEEKAAYRYPDEGWIPLPDVIDEFHHVLISCTFIIEKDGAELRAVILHTHPQYFFLFSLAHEANYLRDNA